MAAPRGRSLPRTDGKGAVWHALTPNAPGPSWSSKTSFEDRFNPMPKQLKMAGEKPVPSSESPLGPQVKERTMTSTTPKRHRDGDERTLPKVSLDPSGARAIQEALESMNARMVALQEELNEHQEMLKRAHDEIIDLKAAKKGYTRGDRNINSDIGDHELEDMDKKDVEKPTKYALKIETLAYLELKVHHVPSTPRQSLEDAAGGC